MAEIRETVDTGSKMAAPIRWGSLVRRCMQLARDGAKPRGSYLSTHDGRVLATVGSSIVLFLMLIQVSFSAVGAWMDSGNRLAAAVRLCSNSDTLSDGDFLPILSIRGGAAEPN